MKPPSIKTLRASLYALALSSLLAIGAKAQTNLLKNGDFEGITSLTTYSATTTGVWGTESSVLSGAGNGITPFGSQMLELRHAGGGGAAQTNQIVQGPFMAGSVVTFTVKFNTWLAPSAQTPQTAAVIIQTDTGIPLTGTRYTSPTVALDSDTSTWQTATVSVTLPADTNYISAEMVLWMYSGALPFGTPLAYADDAVLTVVPPLPTQTLTILGGSGTPGDIAANVEYYNPATGNWQPTYLTGSHPWGFVSGTNSWINYKASNASDPGAGPTTANTLWYLYRVRFTVPPDAQNPTMTFSLKADNFAQVAINGISAGGLITGQTDQVNADAVFSQAVLPGENTITIDVGDFGGLNGFNFRIDLTVQSATSLDIVPTIVPPVVSSQNTSGGYGSSFSYQIAATNAPASFGATGLPASLSLNSATGVISGTLPNTVGNIAVVLSATNTGGTGTGTLNINVLDLTPPVISAPAALTAEATGPAGATVTFSATANDFIGGATPVSATPASGSTFPLGTSTVALSATDVSGNTATGAIAVTVRDTTPPVITAPADIVTEATSAAGAVVMFTASAQDIVDGAVPVLATPASGATFPLGATSVALSATDAAGNSASATFHVTVQDTTAPVIQSLSATPSVLWSPNHKMVPVTVTANASDAVGVTSLKIISVTSNEPADDDGDGHTAGDIQITGNMSVNLRAERSGKGSGRVYTITVEAKDAAGNASTMTTTVTVPKSQGDDDKGEKGDHKGGGDDHKDDGKDAKSSKGKKGGG